MRVEHPSSVLLLLASSLGSLLAPPVAHAQQHARNGFSAPASNALNPELVKPPQPHPQRLPLDLNTNDGNFRIHPRKVALVSAKDTLQSWVDFYGADRRYITENVVSSGSCLPILTLGWGIISIQPMTTAPSGSTDRVTMYNDLWCSSVNNEPGATTGLTLIASYFFTTPKSLKWTRVDDTSPPPPPPPSPPPPSPASSDPAAQTTIAVGTATATPSSGDATSTNAGSTITPPAGGLSPSPTSGLVAPAPVHSTFSTFPTNLLPPHPLNSNTNWGVDCEDPTSEGCKAKRSVNRILIIGLTIAGLAVIALIAGAIYVYRTFYDTKSFGYTSSNRSNTAGGGSSGGGSSGRAGRSRGESDATSLTATSATPGYNDDYKYVHEQDENAPAKFMFDHRHDNIATDLNPKNFQESGTSPTSTRTRYSDSHGQSAFKPPQNNSDI